MMTTRDRPRTREAFANEETLRKRRAVLAEHMETLEAEVADLAVETDRVRKSGIDQHISGRVALFERSLEAKRRALGAIQRQLKVADAALVVFERKRQAERDRASDALAMKFNEFSNREPVVSVILRELVETLPENGHGPGSVVAMNPQGVGAPFLRGNEGAGSIRRAGS